MALSTSSSGLDMRAVIDVCESKVREVISGLSAADFRRPTSFEEVCSLTVEYVEFMTLHSEIIHRELVLVSNVLEDCLRTIFIVNDDATLEGFATELETQLGQLRLISEGLKELPGECNEQMGDILSGWNDRLSVILNNQEKKGKLEMGAVPEFENVGLMISTLRHYSLYNAIHLSFQTYLKTFKESCVKVLSVLSMVAGKWETKIEERIDDEDIQEGMVMTAGRGIRRESRMKGGRSGKKSNLYY